MMINEFQKYVRDNDLCVNVEKTKIVRFRKKGKKGCGKQYLRIM